MEGNMKKLLVVEERPCHNNTDAPYKTEKPSIHNTLGSTLLSLRLNNSEMAPQREGQPPAQIGLLRIKLEEAKKENRNLRARVNQINEYYTALQSRLQLAMQQHQISTSPRNNRELQGNTQDAGKPVLSTRQLLNIGDPSPSDGSTKEGFASAENFKEIGRNLAYMHSGEDEINTQVTSEEAKRKDDQAIEVSRKARVSIRARSDFSLMGDGCQWRKYGQKIAKGNPCPRAYYRCSMGTSCPVRKQVQKCFEDETIIITTYEGKHNHPLPPAARPLASSTSAALNMFLSGSIISSHGTTLSNSFYFPSFSSSPSTATATFSPSVSCPTVTLDLTHQTNNSLQFQRANSLDYSQSFTFPIVPLHGHSTKTLEELYLSSKVPRMIAPTEESLALVDVVSEAIATDPSLKAALFAAISSLNGVPRDINNNHNQSSKSGYEPCSKISTMGSQQP